MVPSGSKTVESKREARENTGSTRLVADPGFCDMSRKPARRWSQRVTRTSNALDLESGVFRKRSPRAIARSLARSAEASARRKAPPFRSAMSMLTFYINRAGRTLSARDRNTLMHAKQELRKLYGRA
jgi:hypothetical protein